MTQDTNIEVSPTETSATEPAVAENQSVESTVAQSANDETPSGEIIIPQPELGASLPPVEEPTERREVEGGRAYEIIFITKAGDADATEASIGRLRAMIEAEGGALDTVRTSEVRRLAYAIKREIEGVYTVVNARFGTQHLAEIDRFFKLEESVLRHMILRDEK